MKEITRDISLLCPLCGNSQFALIDDEYENLKDAPGSARIQCTDCKSEYTKDELLESNSELIENVKEEMKKEAIKEMEKELKKVLKKWK